MSQAKVPQRLDRFRGQIGSLEQDLPRSGQVVVQSAKDMLVDNGPQWAAAVTYYALLSVFPLFIVAAAIASFFVDPAWAVDRVTGILGDFAPEGDEGQRQVNDIVQGAIRQRGQLGLIAFVGLLWTGTRVLGTLTRAMNIAFDADDTYGFFKRLLIEALMLLTIGMFFVLALASGYILGLVWRAVQFLPAQQAFAFELIKEVIQAVMLLIAYFLIYRFVPRGNWDWRAALAGAFVATGLFVIAEPLFQYYVNRFGNYNLIYGSFWIAVVILIWVWIVSLITIFGGEIASHTKMMILDNESSEEVERRHKERSPEKGSRSDK